MVTKIEKPGQLLTFLLGCWWLLKRRVKTNLDANDNATVFDEAGKDDAVVRFLVQRFVEEDDPADTVVDAVVGREEQLAVAPPVLLSVLNPDGIEALRHTAWR